MATVLEIITEALVGIKVVAVGETPDDSDVNDALVKFNDVLESLSLQNLAIYASTNVQFALLPGVGMITLGPGGAGQRPISMASIDSMFVTYDSVDFPLDLITQDNYDSLALKDTTGLPRYAAFRNGFPDAVLSLYPVPDQTCLLTIAQRKQFGAVTLDDVFQMPAGYRRMVRLMLMWELVQDYPGLGPDEVAKLQRDASGAVAMVKRANTEPSILRSEVADMSVSGGGWGDWRLGT